MSDSVGLSDRDQQVLKSIDEDIADANDQTDYEKVAREIRDEFKDFLLRYRADKRKFNHRLSSVEDRLESVENGGSAQPEEQSPIENLANIPKDERGELLSTSKIIAVTLHDEWEDIAWELGGGSNVHGDRLSGKVGVDTKTKANAKNNPSKLRHRLKVSLERDFQANEIYRGMKRLAEIAGGKEHVGDDGRSTVAGGLYKYREVTTADNRSNRRVLWRRQE